MFDLRKLFIREVRAGRGKAAADPDSEYNPSGSIGEGLEVEYQALIATQFRRWGISNACVTIEARKIGQAPDGFDVFVGMVRLTGWQRVSALRVLLGLPLLEAKVRKTVRGTWMADVSHFGGLWLHAAEQVNSQGGQAELRQLLMRLVPPSPVPSTERLKPEHSTFGASSLLASTTNTPPAASSMARADSEVADTLPGEQPVSH